MMLTGVIFTVRVELSAVSARTFHREPFSANLGIRAGTEHPGSNFILEFTGWRSLRRNSRFLPPVCLDRRRLSLIPGEYTV